MIFAAGDPGFPEWVSSTGTLAVLIGIVALFLRGDLVTSKDVDRRLAQHQETCDAEMAAKDVEIGGKTSENALLRSQLDELRTDRDRWREAAEESNRALALAESTTEKALESSKMGTALLAALQTALERGYQSGGQPPTRGAGDGAAT